MMFTNIVQGKNLNFSNWLYGRTREELEEYFTYFVLVFMKSLMTPENLNALIVENGLYITHTNLCLFPS